MIYSKDGNWIFLDGGTQCVPIDAANADYAALVASGDAAKVLPYVAPTADNESAVLAKFQNVIAGVFCGRRESINAELGKINNARARGIALTQIEVADESVILDLNAWETAMIVVREAAIANSVPIDEISWPAPPTAVTQNWLSGF